MATTDEVEGIVYADIDLDYLETIRLLDSLYFGKKRIEMAYYHGVES